MKVVILMAGIGSRLGSKLPKCLTPLKTGYTILDHQLENLTAFAGDIVAVVGFSARSFSSTAATAASAVMRSALPLPRNRHPTSS
jgi:choline kinase